MQYSLMGKMRLSFIDSDLLYIEVSFIDSDLLYIEVLFIDSDLLYIEVLFKAGLTVHPTFLFL